MKKLLIIIALIIILFLIVRLSDLHLKEINAVPGNVEEIATENISDYGKAILFKDENNNSFGLVRVKKVLGLLYSYDGGSFGHMVQEDKPFEAIGLANNNDFLVGIKVINNSKIKYIAIGNHMGEIKPTDSYSLSLSDVKANNDVYLLREVKDNYVLFVLNEYSEDTWTIRAFDGDGKLIADKLFGGEARYINWK